MCVIRLLAIFKIKINIEETPRCFLLFWIMHRLMKAFPKRSIVSRVKFFTTTQWEEERQRQEIKSPEWVNSIRWSCLTSLKVCICIVSPDCHCLHYRSVAADFMMNGGTEDATFITSTCKVTYMALSLCTFIESSSCSHHMCRSTVHWRCDPKEYYNMLERRQIYRLLPSTT